MAAPMSTFPSLLAAYNSSITVDEASKRELLKSLPWKRQATLVGEQHKATRPSSTSWRRRPPKRDPSHNVASGPTNGRMCALRRDPGPPSSVKCHPTAVKLRLEEEAELRKRRAQVHVYTLLQQHVLDGRLFMLNIMCFGGSGTCICTKQQDCV